MPRKHPYVSRRSATPHWGKRSESFKTRAQKRAAGTKRCCLVLTLSVGHSGRAAIAARAGIHNHRPWVWIPGSQASPAPRNDAEKMRPGPLRFAGRGSPLSARQKQTKWIRVDRERVFGIASYIFSRARRPHPEERACERRCANSRARARVSKDEDGPARALMLRDASPRAFAVDSFISRCDAPLHEGEDSARMRHALA